MCPARSSAPQTQVRTALSNRDGTSRHILCISMHSDQMLNCLRSDGHTCLRILVRNQSTSTQPPSNPILASQQRICKCRLQSICRAEHIH
mmetsp:Transcript_67736/g.185750  ORF Transcript_67736/g.185750 Transcript_67736/m.185750 type:complete len:90 (+) Transcript_67736:94-363(+)